MCQRIEKLVRGKGDKEKRKEKNPKEIECSQQSLSGCRPRILENISNPEPFAIPRAGGC